MPQNIPKITVLVFVSFLLSISALAQTGGDMKQDSSTSSSTSLLLKEISVSAYGQNRELSETPAAVNVIDKDALGRYGNSVLSAMNSTPGIRMEERSPGSYRLSIRGSSLRSPFGVRNVKIYYNGIPVTDPGGFSYFNQFSFANMQQIQVLKGPGSSMYGAGNGGVMLINSLQQEWHDGISAGTSLGSYQLNRTFVELRKGDSNSHHLFRYEHLNSNGYREHSAIKKEMLSYDGTFAAGNKTTFSLHLLYNDMNYETPGALTQKEFDMDAQKARPDAGTVLGSVSQNARIMQHNLLLGSSVNSRLSSHWQNTTNIYGLYSQLENPALRNYSKTIDPHFGGRTVFNYKTSVGSSELNINFGAEAQKSFATIGTYGNNKGVIDTMQTNDEIQSSNVLGFVQLSWKIKRWTFEGGAGASTYAVGIKRLYPKFYELKTHTAQVSPRFALMYKINYHASAYVNIARGYSSPTTAELAPSGSAINPTLIAEYGLNYETGIRGHLLAGKIMYDVSVFYYRLSNAIVLRKDSASGDTYTNAGSTKQAGVEARIDYLVRNKSTSFLSLLRIWSAYTGYHFRYNDFVQGSDDFSGKRLPGVAEHTVAAGMDATLWKRFMINATYYFSGKIALNDANTAFADPYHLLGIKCTYKTKIKKIGTELYAGADNLLNQKYSLGNDINAAAGRYYNAAMPLSFYAGLTLHWLP